MSEEGVSVWRSVAISACLQIGLSQPSRWYRRHRGVGGVCHCKLTPTHLERKLVRQKTSDKVGRVSCDGVSSSTQWPPTHQQAS